MPMGVEGDSGDAVSVGHGLIEVPKVEGGIGGHMEGKVVQSYDGAQVERTVIADVGFTLLDVIANLVWRWRGSKREKL